MTSAIQSYIVLDRNIPSGKTGPENDVTACVLVYICCLTRVINGKIVEDVAIYILACVASISVRFRTKERGTRV